MQIQISTSSIAGTVQAPASKSATQRVFALALLHQGKTRVWQMGNSLDELAALDIIQKLGAVVERQADGSLEITGSNLFAANDVISAAASKKILQLHCGESGLSMRMFVWLAALLPFPVMLSGSGSLNERPMEFFENILPQFNVQVNTNAGKAPLTVHGPLKPKNIEIDGSLSSQFLTGLLVSLAHAATMPLSINVRNLKSKPYVALTLQMLQHFGYRASTNDFQQFQILPAHHTTNTIEYRVESDWSGAAFLLVAGAISGSVSVSGLDLQSAQGDKAILQALTDAKASIQISDDEIVVQTAVLQAFHFDARDCPDLFPPLVALAVCCNGESVIQGVSRLKYKESDRATALQQEFAKMGAAISIQDDRMLVQGAVELHAAMVDSHNDHRIAMALAVAALAAKGTTIISRAEAVDKSYPNFYKHLQQLEARMHVEN